MRVQQLEVDMKEGIRPAPPVAALELPATSSFVAGRELRLC